MNDSHANHSGDPQHGGSEPVGKTETDPVCGMRVAANASKSVEHRGRRYYFCSQRCIDRFGANPAPYIAEKPPALAAERPAGVIYTCPMHPQIRQSAPGNCPICGMALEPVMPTADEGENPELRDMTRRFWVALVLSVPLLLLAMGEGMRGLDLSGAIEQLATQMGLPHLMSVTWAQCVEAALATPVVLWAGWPFLERGWRSFVTWRLNMFSLIGLGVAAAYFFSVYAILFPESLPQAFRSAHGLPLYFEAASVIV